MKPVSYTLDHVDTDTHSSFPLARPKKRALLIDKVWPAPILDISNVARCRHEKRKTIHYQPPCYSRVILPGDWT